LTEDDDLMRRALLQARLAEEAGEVPVGAVVVCRGEVIAQAYNQPIGTHDPSAHAEMVALRRAASVLRNYRLSECSVYVTLEPCMMCSGAMFHARVREVVFGAPDPKTGVAGGLIDLFSHRGLNHHTRVRGGVLAEECGQLLRDFFEKRRAAR
jgi:tRNA(adenine34) deaminase